MSVERTLYCSFCGKSHKEVAKLIAGPSTFICSECVDLCREIVSDPPGVSPSKPTDDASLRAIRLRCVELARSYGGRDDELLNRARAIAAFVLGDRTAPASVTVDDDGNVTGFISEDAGVTAAPTQLEGRQP